MVPRKSSPWHSDFIGLGKRWTPKRVSNAMKDGTDLGTRDMFGHTPLHFAAARKYEGPSLIPPLIKRGASVNARDHTGRTPLHLAAYYGRVSGVEALLGAGATVNAETKNGGTPLHFAMETLYHNSKVPGFLIKGGADVNARDSDGNTPLHVAASRNGKSGFVRMLVKHGADVNAKNKKREIPLDLVNQARHPHVYNHLEAR